MIFKNTKIIVMLIVVSLTLTACRAVDTSKEAHKDQKIVEEAIQTNELEEAKDATETAITEEPEDRKIEPVEANQADKQARYTAYKDIMLDLCNNNSLFGYQELPEVIAYEDMSSNEFAVADIDADGLDELIVYYTTTAVAGHIGLIYDYNGETGEFYLKFGEYPLLSFYENGAIEAGWSHNQGYAGDFWPYTLYVYDKDNDTYNLVGFVDAYDRSLYELNKDVLESNPFPYDVDADGNGFVYYLYSDEDNLSDYGMIPAVDDDAYQAWLLQYTEGSNKLEISFYGVTEENINQVFDLD